MYICTTYFSQVELHFRLPWRYVDHSFSSHSSIIILWGVVDRNSHNSKHKEIWGYMGNMIKTAVFASYKDH